MNGRERLESYLGALRRRLRTYIYMRAAGAAGAGLLVLTCASVWLLERQQFAPAVVLLGRGALLVLLVLVAVLLLWQPLRRLRAEDGAAVFERQLPEENGRIRTYLDSRRRGSGQAPSPLIELLAADAAAIASRTPVETLVPTRRIGAGAAVAGFALLGLALLLGAGPNYWGFASRHLLLGMQLPHHAVPVRRIVVSPGDATVRRNSDFAIRAVVEGFRPGQVQVFVRFEDRTEWERAPMQARTQGDGRKFEFKLFALRAPLQYYVEAQGTRSGEHHVAVVDLPRIERMRLTYTYPQWTGLAPTVEESARDIRAVEGTRVQLEIVADAPLDAPVLIVDGKPDALSQDGRVSSGTIAVNQRGRYQIGARVAQELVALSDEYAIELVSDDKPAVEIVRPGRDLSATSIEEVPVSVRAEDDFRLRDVSLLYSVNGGPWQSMPVGGGAQRTEGMPLLRLEEFGQAPAGQDKRLVPGDLITYYAVAKDRRQSAQTDLFILQVQPFERRFTQSQGGGIGSALGDEQGAISERQREILLATWNLQRRDERNSRSRQQVADSARMLSELQATLAQQARTLAQRMQARVSVDEDERFAAFVTSLQTAAGLMDPAVGHLVELRLQQAVPLQQQALQQLLRAESAFRDVQVAMQQAGAGSSGTQAARNFSEMFELEMDLGKNQYESESQVSQQRAQAELEEAVRKLKELAQRQERLAQERARPQAREPEQRWRQEQLRREAEDLRRQLAEMNRQPPQSGSTSAGSGHGGANGSPRAAQAQREERRREQLARALDSVNKALEQMRSATAHEDDDPQQSDLSAREASRNLTRALQQIDQSAPTGFDQTLERLAERAQRLVREQRRVENELHQALAQVSGGSSAGGRTPIDPRRAQALTGSKQQMAEELTDLQSDAREAVHENRAQSPQTSRLLSEIIREIEGSEVMHRLNRSAAEIYYGRAREAAAREGLIAEALEMLERDLREAAASAARERNGRPGATTPDELLAELARLRRALQDAGQQDGARPRAGQRDGHQDDNGQGGERASARAADAGNGAGNGLEAWSPIVPGTSSGRMDEGGGSLARQTTEISERIRSISQRMSRGALSPAELDALRRTANELRSLAGDPLASRSEAMMRALDQIELTALAASAKARERTAPHATSPALELPRYREAVAEYYRRIGSR